MDRDFAIDPRLLNLGNTISSLKPPSHPNSTPEDYLLDYDNFIRDKTPPISTSALTSALLGGTSDLLTSSTLSLELCETRNTGFNDFDAVFRDLDSLEDGVALEGHAVGHLALWIAKNRSIEPSENQLKGLGIVTAVPVAKLSKWLALHGMSILAGAKELMTYPKVQRFSAKDSTYRTRCVVESGFRYRSRKGVPSGHKPFECTNKCGQSFKRKGDWSRHERVNFEEWPCPHCEKILTRYEHLQNHFKDAHPAETGISKSLRRQFLAAQDRPCGFCGLTLTNWSVWLAHVGNHLEGGFGEGSQNMVKWREYRTVHVGDWQPGTSLIHTPNLTASFDSLSGSSEHLIELDTNETGLIIGDEVVETMMRTKSVLEEAEYRFKNELELILKRHQDVLDEHNKESERMKSSLAKLQEDREEQYVERQQQMERQQMERQQMERQQMERQQMERQQMERRLKMECRRRYEQCYIDPSLRLSTLGVAIDSNFTGTSSFAGFTSSVFGMVTWNRVFRTRPLTSRACDPTAVHTKYMSSSRRPNNPRSMHDDNQLTDRFGKVSLGHGDTMG